MLTPSIKRCMSSSLRARSDGSLHELVVEAIRLLSPRLSLWARGLSSASNTSTLWRTVPASFLSLFSPRLRALVGPAQASETAQLPTLSNCSSQGPRARAGPEPLTSHHSSASTSLAYRWASSYHFDRADVQLSISNCPQPRYF